MKTDAIDIAILKELIQDSSQSVKEIAAKVNLSVTPVHDRIKKMKKSGLIAGSTVLLNLDKIGYTMVAYLQIKLVKHGEDIFEEFKEKILQFDEVLEATFTIGDYDVMLKLLLKDMQHYEEFILRKISKLGIIATVKSSFSINYITENQHLVNAKQFSKIL
ncbi:Lrp/AsnC family transcriptional regulator [Riemerella columbina]|uniref:Lrp/AsnC family transcriptional regulator n=1 Tax=Riemerella columbina TaxID=103810 RepID=UPI002670A352|nr:Lrp/AsnC family transcriptional regulator [Riemerella columbina]WKS95645.1 Lrp/AsnC family transcriptional regulator [Riemerella columbina]